MRFENGDMNDATMSFEMMPCNMRYCLMTDVFVPKRVLFFRTCMRLEQMQDRVEEVQDGSEITRSTCKEKIIQVHMRVVCRLEKMTHLAAVMEPVKANARVPE